VPAELRDNDRSRARTVRELPGGSAEELSVSLRVERRRRERHDGTLQELSLALEQIQQQVMIPSILLDHLAQRAALVPPPPLLGTPLPQPQPQPHRRCPTAQHARLTNTHASSTTPHTLSLLLSQMAEQVQRVAEECRVSIEALTADVNARMAPLCDDETLARHTVGELEDVEVSLAELFGQRKSAVDAMMEALARVERERREHLSVALREHGKALVLIAFQLRPDVERTLFSKADQLNRWLLENKAAAAALRARLLSHEISFFEGVRQQLHVRRLRWVQLRQAEALDKLRVALADIPAVPVVVAAAQSRGEADTTSAWRGLVDVLRADDEVSESAPSGGLLPSTLGDGGLCARVALQRQRAETLAQELRDAHERVVGTLELDVEDALAELDEHSGRCQVCLTRHVGTAHAHTHTHTHTHIHTHTSSRSYSKQNHPLLS
jgi:hypothetical protein